MPKTNPIDYVKSFEPESIPIADTVSINKDPKSQAQHNEYVESQVNQFQQVAPETGDVTPYNQYNSDGLNYSENMFSDDTEISVPELLAELRLTPAVRAKLNYIYTICSSKDHVLTWVNSWILNRKNNEFKVQILEFKNTLLYGDADSLLFGDFDMAVEILCSRIEARYSRAYEGFERKANISTYNHAVNYNLDGNPNTTENPGKSGLANIRRAANQILRR
jgi:hypothetical protein